MRAFRQRIQVLYEKYSISRQFEIIGLFINKYLIAVWAYDRSLFKIYDAQLW